MPRPRVRVYWFTLCIVASAAIAVWLGASRAHRWAGQARAQADTDLAFRAQALAREVDLLVSPHIRSIEALATAADLVGIDDRETLQAVVSDHLQADSPLYYVYIGDALGTALVTAPVVGRDGAMHAGTDYSDRDYYQAVRETGRTAVSQVQMGRVTHRPRVAFAAALTPEDKRFSGLAVGAMDLGDLLDVARYAAGRDGARAVILDPNTRIIADSSARPDEVLRDVSQWPIYAAVATPGPVLRDARDDRGTPVRAALVDVALRDSTWTVAVAMPEQRLEQLVAQGRWQAFVVTGAGFLIVALVLGFVLFFGIAGGSTGSRS